MRLKLTFNIKAVPHQSVRIGRNNIAYKPKKIINYQVAIRALAIAQLPKGFEMIPAGTEITIQRLTYQFKYLKSTPKKRRTGKVPKTTKPDLHDNLNKAFMDALEGIVFEQDQNIVKIKNLEKYYDKEDLITLILKY
jgi:Holliday junction resolvase RusA-like endonuclease